MISSGVTWAKWRKRAQITVLKFAHKKLLRLRAEIERVAASIFGLCGFTNQNEARENTTGAK